MLPNLGSPREANRRVPQSSSMRFKWQLGNKIEDASEERLKIAGESCMRWEVGCGLALVVLGLLGEFALAWVHPGYDSIWDRWGEVTCDFAIALGVAGEIFFSSRSHKYSGELTRRSNQRLADLKEATLWRTLTNAERVPIAESLRASGSAASVRFSVLANDPESMYFAGQIGIAFKAAGWRVGYSFESYRHGILTGVLLPPNDVTWRDPKGVANKRVRDAFIAAKLQFANGWPAETYTETGGGEQLTEPIAWVYIGPKPPPALK